MECNIVTFILKSDKYNFLPADHQADGRVPQIENSISIALLLYAI